MSDSGGRPQSVTDEEILRYFRDSGEHILTTTEVAEGLDISRRTALRRLSDLAEEGRVEKKKIGDRSAVWWTSDPESEPEAPAAPLKELVGGLDAETASAARDRSQAWRDSFDEQMSSDQA